VIVILRFALTSALAKKWCQFGRQPRSSSASVGGEVSDLLTTQRPCRGKMHAVVRCSTHSQVTTFLDASQTPHS